MMSEHSEPVAASSSSDLGTAKKGTVYTTPAQDKDKDKGIIKLPKLTDSEYQQQLSSHWKGLYDIQCWETITDDDLRKLVKSLPSFCFKKPPELPEGHKMFDKRATYTTVANVPATDYAKKLYIKSSGNYKAKVLCQYAAQNLKLFVPEVSV